MRTTAIVDFGLGNLRSLQHALEDCGTAVSITSDAKEIERCSHIVMPGVGAFKRGIENLRSRELFSTMVEIHRSQKPLLGICLGMQLFADLGTEFGDTEGLGLIAGRVEQLEPSLHEQIPHVGWNEIEIQRPSVLLSGIEPRTSFYFTHSYRFIPEKAENELALTPFAGRFCSVVGEGNTFGVQFHPEKSGRAGMTVLKNFLSL